ncbi:MAG: GNAT family N-acetyltransferase, partial [Bacteroidota bacterium]
VEAEVLGAQDFPPLRRPISGYQNTGTEFFGVRFKEELAGAIELSISAQHGYIDSLVIHPNYFRQGIARRLMEFVFQEFEMPVWYVETGVENGPATALYLGFDFVEVERWDTDFGVEKVKFVRR